MTPEAIADDYALGAARARRDQAEVNEFLSERGISARELVIGLAGSMTHHRPALRTRLLG